MKEERDLQEKIFPPTLFQVLCLYLEENNYFKEGNLKNSQIEVAKDEVLDVLGNLRIGFQVMVTHTRNMNVRLSISSTTVCNITKSKHCTREIKNSKCYTNLQKKHP